MQPIDLLSRVTALQNTVSAAPAGNTHQSFLDALAQFNEIMDAEGTRLLHEVKEKQDEVAAERAAEEREKQMEDLRREIGNLRSAMAAAPQADNAPQGDASQGDAQAAQLAMMESQLMALMATAPLE